MSRSHAKQREWKKLSRIMTNVEQSIDREIMFYQENPRILELFGKDPTARDAIKAMKKGDRIGRL